MIEQGAHWRQFVVTAVNGRVSRLMVVEAVFKLVVDGRTQNSVAALVLQGIAVAAVRLVQERA